MLKQTRDNTVGTTVHTKGSPSVSDRSQILVLRIHEILVRFRIRIRGSIPLTNGSGSGFGSTFKTLTKNFFFLRFLLITFWRYIYIIFLKIKKSYRSHKTLPRNQCFSYYFCLMTEGSGSGPGSVSLSSGSGSATLPNTALNGMHSVVTACSRQDTVRYQGTCKTWKVVLT